MSENGLSESVERFIAAEIHSLEQLEILLLLSGNPHKWFNTGTVYEVIKSNRSSVAQWLERLTERKMLTRDSSSAEAYYKFSPTEENVWKQVTELRDSYKERSVKVVQAIYATKTPTGVTEFARAFRVRKKEG